MKVEGQLYLRANPFAHPVGAFDGGEGFCIGSISYQISGFRHPIHRQDHEDVIFRQSLRLTFRQSPSRRCQAEPHFLLLKKHTGLSPPEDLFAERERQQRFAAVNQDVQWLGEIGAEPSACI